MTDDLDEAVDELFHVFASSPLDEQVEFCRHCIDPDQFAQLHATPLRQVTPDHLGPLLFNAISLWGDVDYFKHFLPRLLQLVAAGEMEDWSYASSLPSPLRQCWDAGSAGERAAIARFLRAWWSATISLPAGRCRPGDVLEVIDECGLSVRPHLEAWPAADPATAVPRLAAFVRYWIPPVISDDPFFVEIDRWLCSGIPTDMFDQFLDRGSNPEVTSAAELLALYRMPDPDERTTPVS